jgi:hypothetical protein
MFRYDPDSFSGLPRSTFLKALSAEGVPASSGYLPLNKEPLIERALSSRAYQSLYGSRHLADYRDRISCPINDLLCTQAVWLTQTTLLGPRSDMDLIALACRKIHRHAAKLAQA